MKYKNILWDWNGTLTDDLDIALEAVNIMLERRKLPIITLEQYYTYITTPIIGFYEKCFDMTKDSEKTLLPEYQSEYRNLAKTLPKNDETFDTVKRLNLMGVRQFVVSSCEEAYLLEEIKKYKIDCFLECVTGAPNIRAESKVSRAKKLMDTYGLVPSETVFIGDTAHDLETARAIGVDCILVTFGHQFHKKDKKTGCVIADSLCEIADYFKSDL